VFSFLLTESYENRAFGVEVVEPCNEVTNKLKPELPIIAFASVSFPAPSHFEHRFLETDRSMWWQEGIRSV
jgi:hypothetical protein